MVNQDGGHRVLPDQSLMCEARHGVVIAMDSEFARVNILTDLLRFVLHRTADEMDVSSSSAQPTPSSARPNP